MFADRYIFGLARSLAKRDAQPVPVEDRDPFSSMERYIMYGDYPTSIWWSKGIVADRNGKMRECERVEVSCALYDEDTEAMEEELDVVYQGVFLPDEGVVETFHYIPDVWTEYLENRARRSGTIT